MGNTRLILFAHGSGDPRWRAPFEKLEQDLVQDLGRENVALAYMEFVAPTLLDVAEDSARDGVTELRVLPIFLSAGAHVAQDIPAQANAAQQRHPNLTVKVLPPIGEDPRFGSLLREVAREAAGHVKRPSNLQDNQDERLEKRP